MAGIVSTISAVAGSISNIAPIIVGSTTTSANVTISDTTDVKVGDTINIIDALFTSNGAVSGTITNDFRGQNLSGTVSSIINSTKLLVTFSTVIGTITGFYVSGTASLYTTRDEFYRDNYIAVDLVEIHLKNSSGVNSPIYLCNGGFDITYDSTTAPNTGNNVYQAQGEFMGFSEMAENFDVALGKFTIYLSGLGTDYLNKFTANNPEGKRVVIYKAFLEYAVVNDIEGLYVVPDPLMMFDGVVYNVTATESRSTCQINVECSTLFADFDRTSGRRTNTGSNWLFQGTQYDTSMEQAGFVGESNFLWGKV
jgi:hypothetical protein